MTAFNVIYGILTYTASAFSVLMNASPVVTIRRVEEAGTIGISTITFYGAQMYNGITWASYGVFITSIPMLISCCIGNAVSTYCTLVFLTVARREERSGKKLQSTTYTKSLLTSLLFLVVSWGHLVLCVFFIAMGRVEVAKTLTGYEGSIASVLMLSSPLMMFKTIVATKNAESLAPLTVTFGFFNTLLWTIAGLMTGDPFIIVPNLLCFLACCAQYVLLFLYGRTKHEKVEVRQAIPPVPFDY